MGTTISSVACVYKCCFTNNTTYIGHKIFKPIDTHIEIDENESEEVKQILNEYILLLQKTEEERSEIANKFETMLINTGACVFRRPTTERAIITYVIFFLVKLHLSAKKKKVEFNIEDFKISKLFAFSIKPPFINLNDSENDFLKEKYGFNFDKDTTLQNGKSSIYDFLSSLEKCKELFNSQITQIKNISKKINSIKHITQIKHITKGIDVLSFMMDVLNEISSTISGLSGSLNTDKIKLLNKIAIDACNNNISDPKEIAFNYSSGDTCKKINEWKENMCYKEIEEELKY